MREPIVEWALIVDDSPDDRYLLKRLLRRAKTAKRVVEAENGQAALDHLRENALTATGELPSLVFLDINMPIMGGFEFLQEFARMREGVPELETVVLAMFSSSQHDADHARVSEYPFVKGYIVKMPSDGEELRAAIEECLAK
ncbi:MAG: response regulator [Nannocystaceae bacterium]|nr:response regulator [Nannocystaceae bacterium]